MATQQETSSDVPETNLRVLDRASLNLLTEYLKSYEALNDSTAHAYRPVNLATVHEFAKQHSVPAELIISWLQHTHSLCRRLIHTDERVAVLGPKFSYSHLAAIRRFGMGIDVVPVATIEAAFEEVARGHSKYAVVPIENSTDGRIVDTLSNFARHPQSVCGEIVLPIHHCLLARCRRSEIREVRSKPQALSQCRGWLASHLPEAKLVEVTSTAAAAADAAEQPGVAAIASREAGIQYDLEVVAENIEDNPGNATRFVVLGESDSEPTGNDKTLLILRLVHRPGALADAMNVFRDAVINMTWIESFPLANAPSEYLFFIEFEGHRKDPKVAGALGELARHAQRLDILGSYPKASE